MRTIAIVGGSLAGVKAAETLRAEGFAGAIKIIGDEPPYDRPPLSKEILAGEMSPDDTLLTIADDLQADWLIGSRAVALDTATKRLSLEGGDALAYDGLVIATGSAPRRLRGLDPDGDRVLELRTMADAIRLRDILASASRLVIVGCGFIGVEVASAARSQGVEVTVVSLDPPLIQAGALIGQLVEAMLREHGVELLLGRTVRAIAREGERRRAVLDDGRDRVADAVLVAVGAVPRTSWLEGSGLEIANGIVCDGALRATGADDVVAAGDVARWPNPIFPGATMRIEHWNNAVEQGAAAARALLAGSDAAMFESVPSFWSDHFGVRLRTVGMPGSADTFEVTSGDIDTRQFASAAYRGGRLVGGVGYGVPRALARLRRELTSQATAKTEE